MRSILVLRALDTSPEVYQVRTIESWGQPSAEGDKESRATLAC